MANACLFPAHTVHTQPGGGGPQDRQIIVTMDDREELRKNDRLCYGVVTDGREYLNQGVGRKR